MRIWPLNFQAYIRSGEIKLVDSLNKRDDGGLFSTSVFGVTEHERSTKRGYINLHTWVMTPSKLDIFRRVDRSIYKCCTDAKAHFAVVDGELVVFDPRYHKPFPNGVGPAWLYEVWDEIDKRKYLQKHGKYANIELKKVMARTTRDEMFIHHQWVSPVVIRQEVEGETMMQDEINIYLEDILRYSNIIKNGRGDMTHMNDIIVALQNKVLEFYDFLSDKYLGPHGTARKNTMSRTVDYSARAVILPVIYKDDVIGEGKLDSHSVGVPIHICAAMFMDSTIKYAKDFINRLYDEGCFDEGVSIDMLAVYDKEFLHDQIKKLEDSYHRVQPFMAITKSGDFKPLVIPMEVYDKKTKTYIHTEKELTWMEFFYIVLETYLNVYETRAVKGTRYPTDSTLSTQFLRPVILTLYPIYLKTVNIFGIEYKNDYPLVDEYILNNYNKKIFENAVRAPAGIVVAWSGDFDGDQIGKSPINSKEAVADARRINKSLLQHFSYTGDFRNSVGKDGDQTLYTFTRNRKPYDPPAKTIKSNHEFIEYIMNIKDGKISVKTLLHYTRPREVGKEPEVSIYDNVTINFRGENIKTTVGRLLVNKVIFTKMWDNPHWTYLDKPFSGKTFDSIINIMKQMYIEDKITDTNDIKVTIDRYTEFGLRLSTLFNANITDSMILGNDEFDKIRKEKLNAIKKDVVENKDTELLNKTIVELEGIAKEMFKDDQMMEIFESGNSGKFDNHFRNMNIAMGAMPMLDGRTSYVFDSLSDGISTEYIGDMANIGMTGAINRGLQTGLAGAAYKQVYNAAQNIRAVWGDCGDKEGIEIVANNTKDILNKYVIEKDGSNTLITSDNISNYLGKKLRVRSPLKCKEKNGHFCSHCIGIEPFKLANKKEMYIGVFISDSTSMILNMFMKVTHNMGVEVFRIFDLHKYIYPKPNRTLFEIRHDDIDKVDKVYTTEDLVWMVPQSAVNAEGTYYSILAHGSILETKNSQPYSFVLGTEILTKPDFILKPGHAENPSQTHYKLIYNAGSPFIENSVTTRKEMTVYKMFNLFIKGGITNLIPLEMHLETFHNTVTNNKKVNISDTSLGILIASLARDASDLEKPVRETGRSEYVMVGCDDLTIMSGTFNAFFGNDARRAITIASSKEPDEQDKVISPLEIAYRN